MINNELPQMRLIWPDFTKEFIEKHKVKPEVVEYIYRKRKLAKESIYQMPDEKLLRKLSIETLFRSW